MRDQEQGHACFRKGKSIIFALQAKILFGFLLVVQDEELWPILGLDTMGLFVRLAYFACLPRFSYLLVSLRVLDAKSDQMHQSSLRLLVYINAVHISNQSMILVSMCDIWASSSRLANGTSKRVETPTNQFICKWKKVEREKWSSSNSVQKKRIFAKKEKGNFLSFHPYYPTSVQAKRNISAHTHRLPIQGIVPSVLCSTNKIMINGQRMSKMHN